MIVCIANNKGGVLKTTIATNIACELAKLSKVCLLDLDGQGNIANTFKTSREINDGIEYTFSNFLFDKISLNKIIDKKINSSIQNQNLGNLNVIYSDYRLNDYDRNLLNGSVKNIDVKNAINQLNRIYDFVLIDTAPMLNTLTTIAISMSDILMIPFECDKYAVNGLMNIVKILKNNFKSEKRQIFLIATKFNKRNRLHNEYFDLIDSYTKTIPNLNIKLMEEKISFSTKSALTVASENVPLVLSKSNSELMKRLKEEFKSISKQIIKNKQNINKI